MGMPMRRDLTGRFECAGDSGRRYVVDARTAAINSKPMTSQGILVDREVLYTTHDGKSVGKLDDGSFLIIATGEMLIPD